MGDPGAVEGGHSCQPLVCLERSTEGLGVAENVHGDTAGMRAAI